MNKKRIGISIVSGALIAAYLVAFAPTALAGAPNSGGSGTSVIEPSAVPPAQWLALKNAGRIRSGVRRNQAKGTPSHVYIAPAATLGSRSGSISPDAVTCSSGFPCSDELSTNNPVPNVFEPGDGCHPNFGVGTPQGDDANPSKNYCSDTNFFNLCGPGAADVALWYWPAPPNLMNNAGVVDPQTGTSTTWNGYDTFDNVPRMRGYLTYLAFQMKASGWTQPGMMEQTPGIGVRLQEEAAGINWEESGRSTNNGFYVVAWRYDTSLNPSGHTQSDLHTDVAEDISLDNVPVVVEVNAQLMPNWINRGTHTNHYVTVIGYDDTLRNTDGSLGVYYYTDTCAKSTNCGSNAGDGGIYSVSYNQMWTAVQGVPFSQNTGDGGWVW